MKTLIMILMSMAMISGTVYGQAEEQAPPIPAEEQPEVLTRGPVNEAFAQPVTIEEEGDFVVPEEPPPEIAETVPAERPVGDFTWVPGYWAWDSDRNAYIWVSGCWRAVPPGQYWVPGYWTKVSNGWRWVAGFWAPLSSNTIEYLPPPPAVYDVAPPVTASPGMIWVPPCWYWYSGHYTLRSGYWIAARENWVWVPSHYVWTPRGYVFVSGHWDYPLRRRGVLFAPVYFPGRIHTGVRFSYSLSIVVNLGNLEFGLFTRPRYSHYYFGDYYDSFYIGIGIFPWFDCVTRYTWYDPIYLHDSWRYSRHDPNWRKRERHEYERRRTDRNLRPPRTYREMEHRMRNMNEKQRRNFELAEPMNRMVKNKTTTFRFRQDKPEVRKQISRQADDVRRYARERSKWESPENDGRTTRSAIKSTQSAGQMKVRGAADQKRTETRKQEPGRGSSTDSYRMDNQETRKDVSRSVNNTQRYTSERNRSDSGEIISGTNRSTVNSYPSDERKVVRERDEHKVAATKRAEPRGYSNNERVSSGRVSNMSRESSMSSQRQERTSDTPRYEENKGKPDNVAVRTSPVASKNRGGIFRKRAPSQPKAEEERLTRRR